MPIKRFAVAVFLVLVAARVACAAEAYPIGDGQTVIGEITYHAVTGGESLHEVALLYGVGYNGIVGANPSVEPWTPGVGTALIVPTLFVLPRTKPEGIVINLAEMRLYLYADDAVRTYPVGHGTEARNTPTGRFTVMEKLKDPYWIVPESIRREDPGMPRVVPPGKGNPLGKYAIRLSDPEYLIHGTNRPLGIGRMVSHGCIRMYPDDIEELYHSVRRGIPVRIIYQPVKVGTLGEAVYVEAHRDYMGKYGDLWEQAVSMLARLGLLERTDKALLRQALRDMTGLPLRVTAQGATKAASLP